MKWILSIALVLGVCLTAEARPHFKGKVRGWWYKHRSHTTAVVVVAKKPDPKCACCEDCKCGPCPCGKFYKCAYKCKCGEKKKETHLFVPKPKCDYCK